MTLRVAKQWICQAMRQRLLDILRLAPWENVRFALKANGCVDWTWLVLLLHAPLFARRWDCSGYVNFGVWQLVRCSSSGDISEPSTFDTWLCVCVCGHHCRFSLPECQELRSTSVVERRRQYLGAVLTDTVEKTKIKPTNACRWQAFFS